MITSVPGPPDVSTRQIFAALLLGIGVLAFAGVWTAVASAWGGHAGWMVLAAALNSIAWLRFSGTPTGPERMLLAFLATVFSIVLGEWLVAALPIASAMGQFPLETAGRIGLDLGWMLIRLGNTPLDWLMVLVALMLAAWFGR